MEKENLFPNWFTNTLGGIGVLFLFETFRDSDWATLIPYIIVGYPILLLCILISYSHSRKWDYRSNINPEEQIQDYSYRDGAYFSYISLCIIGFFTLILLVDFRIYIHSAESLIRSYLSTLTEYSYLPVILYIIGVLFFAISAFYLTVKIKPLWDYSDGYNAYKTGRGLLFVENEGNRQNGFHGPTVGQYESALPHFDIAIKRGYNDAAVFYFRACCLHSLGFLFDALEDYNRAIELTGEYEYAMNKAQTYYFRSVTKDSLFDYEGSLDDIKEAIRIKEADKQEYLDNNEIPKVNSMIEILYAGQLEDVERKIKWESRSPKEATEIEAELKKIKRREPKLY